MWLPLWKPSGHIKLFFSAWLVILNDWLSISYYAVINKLVFLAFMRIRSFYILKSLITGFRLTFFQTLCQKKSFSFQVFFKLGSRGFVSVFFKKANKPKNNFCFDQTHQIIYYLRFNDYWHIRNCNSHIAIQLQKNQTTS